MRESGVEGRPSSSQTVTGSAGILLSGILSSRILGLVRDMLLARWLPVDSRDVFVAAFRLPNVFRRILGEGALSAPFVPVYVGLSEEEPEVRSNQAEKFARGVLGLLLAVSLSVVGLGLVFMPQMMTWLLQGEAFSAVPGKLEKTIDYARIMFGFVAFATVYGWAASVLAGHRRFAAAAFAPCAFNLAMIAGFAAAFFFRAPQSVIAYGVLLGGGLQAFVALAAVKSSGVSIIPKFDWSMPEVRRFLWHLLPGVIGLSVGQLTILVNMHLASRLERGAQSYLYLTDRLLELPLSLFAVSLGSALLPVLSQSWRNGDRKAMGNGISGALRFLSFIAMPSALGLFVLAEPIARILFEGPEFGAREVETTAAVLRISSLSLVFQSFARILTQGLHAARDVRLPAFVAGLALLIHVVVAWQLSMRWGIEGLAAAGVISSGLQILVLWTSYGKKQISLEWNVCVKSFARHFACALVMAIMIWQIPNAFERSDSRLLEMVELLFAIVLGAGVYFLVAKLIGVEELRLVLIAFRRRFPSRTK